MARALPIFLGAAYSSSPFSRIYQMTSSAPDRSRHLPTRVGSILLILMSVTACAPSSDDAGVTERPPVDGAEYRLLDVNGIRMRVVEQGEGPLVLLVHGWPESWYSWRHQLPALAAAGYHAVAPDMRGYGGTDAPSEIEDYDIFDLCGDLVGLIDALGEEQAVLVAHDWGALAARDCVRLEADRFSAVVNMSVPFGGWAGSPIEGMRSQYGDNFFYILYFQELDTDGQGVAEAEFDADPRGILSRLYLTGATVRPPVVTDPLRSAGGWIPRMGEPTDFPAWITEGELDYYVEELTRSGFRGGINYYRNIQRNWELTPELRDMPVSQPAMFISGANDGVIGGATQEALTASLGQAVTDLRGVHLIPEAGHWVQQEKPEEVNRVLLEFLAELPLR
jgi:pimeloyl-ACP methyl ester carboxylesterase